MRTRFGLLLLAAWAICCSTSNIRGDSLPPNAPTEKEKAAGWKLLFDGTTTKGWRETALEGQASQRSAPWKWKEM